MRVAIVGNPNAGKTTLFNMLTGLHARVGNYPGTTVESRSGQTSWQGEDWEIWDLPGCYSLQAEHGEESQTLRALTGLDAADAAPLPDVVVALVDRELWARGLYLVLQLAELAVPLVIAVNDRAGGAAAGLMPAANDLPASDPAQSPAGPVLAAVRAATGAAVVEVSARDGRGLPSLMRAVHEAARRGPPPDAPLAAPDYLGLSAGERAAVAEVREALERARARPGGDSLPRPSLGICLTLLTARVIGRRLPPDLVADLGPARASVGTAVGSPLRQRLIAGRYARVDAWLRDARPRPPAAATAGVDRLLLHPLAGSAVLLAALAATFQLVFMAAAPVMDATERGLGWLGELLTWAVPAGLTHDLLCFGVLAGIANVLMFVPQIALLFAVLTAFEECGYMARAALLLDRVMRRVGLGGRAFMPLMTSFGCAVPGILATRSLETRRERLATMLVAPWMSCSARLPAYAMVVGAFFAQQPAILGVFAPGACLIVGMYLLGIVAAGTALSLLRRRQRPEAPALLIELPPLRIPGGRDVGLAVAAQVRDFVARTGSLIVVISVVLWGLMTLPASAPPAEVQASRLAAAEALPEAGRAALERRWQAEDRARRLERSFAGRMGHALEPVLAPLGFDWRVGVALIAAFAAREVLVSTLAQTYALSAGEVGQADETGLTLSQALRHGGPGGLTPLTGVGLMVFFALALQCTSTTAVMRRETGGWRWPLAQLAMMNLLAYLSTLAVVQGGRALGWR